MGNFIAHLLVYVKSLSDDVHLPQHLRKSSKIDFQFLVPRKLVRVWYHWKWFFKLYTLSYSDSSFIRWAQKSKKSRNSAYICRERWNLSRSLAYILPGGWMLFGCPAGDELRLNEFRKLLLKHYHKLPLSHIEHDTKSHFNHPLPKHPKTDFFNNLMSYTSQALQEGISNFRENFENFSENSKFR